MMVAQCTQHLMIALYAVHCCFWTYSLCADCNFEVLICYDFDYRIIVIYGLFYRNIIIICPKILRHEMIMMVPNMDSAQITNMDLANFITIYCNPRTAIMAMK